MRPTIVIDANPIISALMGGFSREVIFNHHFEFITTDFTIKEIIKYIPYIAKKADVSEDFIRSLLNLLPLRIYKSKTYQEKINEAEMLVRDKKDVKILALALATSFPLWSNDKHFDGIKEIKLIKTKDFV
jgi:predicted nucleic acid-binding protein